MIIKENIVRNQIWIEETAFARRLQYNIQKRHWLAHGKYLGMFEDLIQSIIDHLLDKTEQALDKTFKLAPQDFNQEIGSVIDEQARQCLRKLK
ncbi:MAG: hypothetical protein NWQ54_11825 [Paraglaciecola sp.]|uniref:hypothetical protein n=1 Tax=Flavobacterium sp. W21_SRS_FM6 TaxID=3240268 RepID=UPI00274B70FE|nr:hypothetical protein [Paraglaciecola sp.]